MRILSKRQLRELVLYSPQHIARLEKAGEFPKRIQLGPSRVGWVESELRASIYPSRCRSADDSIPLGNKRGDRWFGSRVSGISKSGFSG